MAPTQEKEDFDTPEEYISFLEKKVKRLESNKKKLLTSLQIKADKDSEHFIYMPESELTNFMHMNKCDQKLMGILYWDKLSDTQKKQFTDWEELELSKSNERRLQQIMSDPTKLRQHFLRNAAPVMDTILKLANGDKKLTVDNFAIKEVWEVLKGIITQASNPAPMLNLKGKEVSDQIDEILSQLTTGQINFDEAKEFMSLVSAGYNLQELPKLMAKLEALEQL